PSHITLAFPLYILRPTLSTLSPYTTLFRSEHESGRHIWSDGSRTLDLLIKPHGIPPRGEPPPRSARPLFSLTVVKRSEGRSRTSDRKSTRLNSSHQIISYAVFCLKKKSRQA